ncbi:MAG: hypothetical protein KIH69_016015 [Anaerolineae bacterium]|nr:hypothetical protein [Anaerolineae bacterium]
MMQFLDPKWRSRYALWSLIGGALVVRIITDAQANHRPEVYDLQTIFLAVVLSWMPADLGMTAIDRLKNQLSGPLKWLAMAGVGIVTVAFGNAFHSFVPGLVMLFMASLSLLPDVLMGLLFTLRETFVAACLVGSVAGVICGGVLPSEAGDAATA